MPRRARCTRGQAGRPCADDEDALTGWLALDRELPPLSDRLITEEAFNAVDSHRLVELAAVTGGLAG